MVDWTKKWYFLVIVIILSLFFLNKLEILPVFLTIVICISVWLLEEGFSNYEERYNRKDDWNKGKMENDEFISLFIDFKNLSYDTDIDLGGHRFFINMIGFILIIIILFMSYYL